MKHIPIALRSCLVGLALVSSFHPREADGLDRYRLFQSGMESPILHVDADAASPTMFYLADLSGGMVSIEQSPGSPDVPLRLIGRADISEELVKFDLAPNQVVAHTSDEVVRIEVLSPTLRRISISNGESLEYEVLASPSVSKVSTAAMLSLGSPKTSYQPIQYSQRFVCYEHGNVLASLLPSIKNVSGHYSGFGFAGFLSAESPISVGTPEVDETLWGKAPIWVYPQYARHTTAITTGIQNAIQFINEQCNGGTQAQWVVGGSPGGSRNITLEILDLMLDTPGKSSRFRRHTRSTIGALDTVCTWGKNLSRLGAEELLGYARKLAEQSATSFNGTVELRGSGRTAQVELWMGIPRTDITMPLACDADVSHGGLYAVIENGFVMYRIASLSAPNSTLFSTRVTIGGAQICNGVETQYAPLTLTNSLPISSVIGEAPRLPKESPKDMLVLGVGNSVAGCSRRVTATARVTLHPTSGTAIVVSKTFDPITLPPPP